MKNKILNLSGIKIFITCIIIYSSYACNNNRECDPIQVNQGDTIIFRYPNIPQNMRYKDANIKFYQPHTDSVVITHYEECKNIKHQ